MLLQWSWPTGSSYPAGYFEATMLLYIVALLVLAYCCSRRCGKKNSVQKEREVIRTERVLVICPYCSAKVEHGSSFCPNCGGKL